MKEIWVIDGLEDSPRGHLARVELPSGETCDLPLSELPAGVREGDRLEVRFAGGERAFRRLEAETRTAHAEAQERLERLEAGSHVTTNAAGEIDL